MNIELLSKLIIYKDIFKFIPELKKYYEKYLQIKNECQCTQETFKVLLKKYNDIQGILKYSELMFNFELNKYILNEGERSQTYYPRL